MRLSLLFFFLLLCTLNFSLAQGSYEDCCLRYSKEVESNIKKRVQSYRRQEQDGGCNLPAIVFKTKRNRQFCARPEDKWVQELMKQVDTFEQRKKNPIKRRYKHNKRNKQNKQLH